MKINQFNAQTQANTKNITNDISKLADPAKAEKNVNKFIQDVYENDINTSLQEIANFNDAIGFMQIADGALQSISDNVSDIKSLQVRANNATLNSDNLSAINSQINALSQNINDTLSQTKYNGKSVFGEFDFNGINVNTSMPEFSTGDIEGFEDSLNSALSSIGAFNSEAQSKVNGLSQFVINTSYAKSQNETDIAKTVTDLNSDKLKLNAQLLAQAHSLNLSEQSLMNLLT